MNTKDLSRYSIMIFCSLLWIATIFLGKSGIGQYIKIRKEIVSEKHKILRLENQIKDIDYKISRWTSDDFEAEKVARQDLLMGLPEEKVYLLRPTVSTFGTF